MPRPHRVSGSFGGTYFRVRNGYGAGLLRVQGGSAPGPSLHWHCIMLPKIAGGHLRTESAAGDLVTGIRGNSERMKIGQGVGLEDWTRSWSWPCLVFEGAVQVHGAGTCSRAHFIQKGQSHCLRRQIVNGRTDLSLFCPEAGGLNQDASFLVVTVKEPVGPCREAVWWLATSSCPSLLGCDRGD